GTAKSTAYQVIVGENNMSMDEVQSPISALAFHHWVWKSNFIALIILLELRVESLNLPFHCPTLFNKLMNAQSVGRISGMHIGRC
ncbi:hypothetical protein KIN20_020888, partial [Parelaphostrongylus tenuis]